jgi:hypothetical protein
MVHLTGCPSAPDWPRVRGYHPGGDSGPAGPDHSAFARADRHVHRSVGFQEMLGVEESAATLASTRKVHVTLGSMLTT